MKFYKLPTVAFPIVLALVTACGSTPGGNVADKPSHSGASRALTENDLANATYRINELGTFSLNNGEFNRQYGAGETQRHKVALEKVAFGDLDHDGLSDAAVILAWQSGGSGAFKYLMAMRNTGSVPSQQDGILLGDRVQISALSIAAGEVRLDTLTSGPHDPVCCPSQQMKRIYILHDGKWVRSADNIANSTASIASNAILTGIVWKWERFEDTSKLHDFVVDDPNKYTLILLPDGTYRAKADCNRMQGLYTLDGSRIKIAPGAATLAECEPGSRYAEYLRHLSEAISFVLRDNKLVLNLMMDGGSLVFEHGEAVSNIYRY